VVDEYSIRSVAVIFAGSRHRDTVGEYQRECNGKRNKRPVSENGEKFFHRDCLLSAIAFSAVCPLVG